MKKIVIASKNPVKINAVIAAFGMMFQSEIFESTNISAPSGVSDQPLTDEETFIGASNRLEHIIREIPDADFWVAIEGGVEEKNGEMEAFAWMIVRDGSGMRGKGRTGTFFLPQAIAKLIEEGKELGEADDIVFGRTNSNQENGAVGLLTDNVVDRTKYYIDAVVFALIPFKNTKYYA